MKTSNSVEFGMLVTDKIFQKRKNPNGVEAHLGRSEIAALLAMAFEEGKLALEREQRAELGEFFEKTVA